MCIGRLPQAAINRRGQPPWCGACSCWARRRRAYQDAEARLGYRGITSSWSSPSARGPRLPLEFSRWCLGRVVGAIVLGGEHEAFDGDVGADFDDAPRALDEHVRSQATKTVLARRP